ncbi:MAG TPA: enoyl-CoA hydratase [Allosphingosinicella sp.]|nr:enoyl-CoA hydratase [Allosphingosinicella sp.]
MGQPGQIRLEYEGLVAWITIDNPDKRNAISLTMWRELNSILHEVKDETRCIVVRGAGDKAFAAGADISEFEGMRRSPEDIAANEEIVDSAMARLSAMPQPTVAMISGYCFGGGVALALCCDVRLAADTSQFAVPAARIGIGYGATGLKNLLETVGVPVAMDIMMSARRYSAAEAVAAGLVNRVYPVADLAQEVKIYSSSIASNAPLTVRATKRMIRELTRVGPHVDLDLCNRLAAECFASDDFLEGARAFMEKRAPRFSGH